MRSTCSGRGSPSGVDRFTLQMISPWQWASKDAADLYTQVHRLEEVLSDSKALPAVDWKRALVATEIAFVSNNSSR